MWLLIGFRRLLVGFWRLLVGLAIGAFLYVWLFFSYKDIWEKIHTGTHDFMSWLVAHPWFVDYSQWSTLLHLDEKLAFALFILIGRMIWMLFEGVFLSFPYWLMIGRHKKAGSVGSAGPTGASSASSETSPSSQAASSAAAVQSAPVQSSIGLSPQVQQPQPKVSADTAKTGDKAETSIEDPDRGGADLEHHIEDALERIRKVGKQNSTSSSGDDVYLS